VQIGERQYIQSVRMMVGTSVTSVLAVAAGTGCPDICESNLRANAFQGAPMS
jgi:hypothetical protein